LANKALFFLLPKASMPSSSITAVRVRLADGAMQRLPIGS
jgi:hypothetical protein